MFSSFIVHVCINPTCKTYVIASNCIWNKELLTQPKLSEFGDISSITILWTFKPYHCSFTFFFYFSFLLLKLTKKLSNIYARNVIKLTTKNILIQYNDRIIQLGNISRQMGNRNRPCVQCIWTVFISDRLQYAWKKSFIILEYY